MDSMNVFAIIQERMGLTCLKGETLKTMLGNPLLDYIIDRFRCMLKF